MALAGEQLLRDAGVKGSLEGMVEIQSMAALVFFHWLESVVDLMVVLTRSRIDLLKTQMLLLAGLISLHSTQLGKESLWPFIAIKA